jgi:hypothetical protein
MSFQDTRQLQKPVSRMAGIGRMLWWGGAQTVPSISALLSMPSEAAQASDLFVLSDTALQRWQLTLDEPEKVPLPLNQRSGVRLS